MNKLQSYIEDAGESERFTAYLDCMTFLNRNGKKFVVLIEDLEECLHSLWEHKETLEERLGKDWTYEETKYRDAFGAVFGDLGENSVSSLVSSQTAMTVRALELYSGFKQNAASPILLESNQSFLAPTRLRELYGGGQSREDFQDWLGHSTNLSSASIVNYAGAIAGVLSRAANFDLFSLENSSQLEAHDEEIRNSAQFQSANSDGNGMYSAALRHLTKYLKALGKQTNRKAFEISATLGSQGAVLSDALLAKPFTILTGASGTGKTKVAESIADYLGDKEGTNHALVPVGADWTDNRPVLGFVNHLRNVKDERPIFQTTPIVDLLLRAHENLEVPHFLILDEMNLSHVERYFADFLSAMEQTDGVLRFHGEGSDNDFRLPRCDGDDIGVPQAIPYPKNLFVIGTVNIDETTYMFSPKVLDRANVIEFGVKKGEIEDFLKDPKPYPKTERAEDGMAEGFQKLAEDARGGKLAALAAGPKQTAAEHLTELFVILKAGRFEFAYRTANEVMRYLGVCSHLAENKEDWNGSGWKTDLDDQILQKLLPKLHGSIGRVGGLLADLAHYCKDGKPMNGSGDKTTGSGALQEATKLEESGAVFPKSLKKLKAMIQTLRDEQFVSFIQ